MRAKRTGQGLITVANAYGKPIAYTPTVTWPGNTITTQSGFYIKEPGKLLVWVAFLETVGTASATLTITLPGGYTAVSMAGAFTINVGSVSNGANATVQMYAAPGATTSIASNTSTGAVAVWSGFFVIPTLS